MYEIEREKERESDGKIGEEEDDERDRKSDYVIGLYSGFNL